ncbi:PREDICTED: venom acid phosphatase Acph-1-like [Polistes canadensis]|uniref:venom acid phosphatase Acph-1-like n=1 Tax=Polistes canadensis TaxID=91411 RepID=UPI000718B905|nr:PREDICTED: venom acid phosphatase Acph-1-like [Polistes canadensis]
MVAFIYASEDNNFELKLLNVIFRHGDRTLDDTLGEQYPNDPYLNYSFYPMGKGQLTNNGKLRVFKLGEFLRKRYDNYLDTVYIPKMIEAYSSDLDRTKASLQLVLAGLFPAKGIQIWNPKLLWQPIPTKYNSRVNDNLFLADECPRYLDEYNKVLESSEFKKESERYKDLAIELTKYTGHNISTPLHFTHLYETLMIQYYTGLSLPAWTKPFFPNGRLYDAALFGIKIGNYNKSLRKLYGGAMLKEFIKNMIGYVNGTLEKETKLFLYSGHEINIISLLFNSNLYEQHYPEFSSSIFMELLYKEEIYYVRILYYLGIPPELKVLRLPGCEDTCPLDKFFQLTIDDIPSDEDMICDKTKTPRYADQKYDLDRSQYQNWKDQSDILLYTDI